MMVMWRNEDPTTLFEQADTFLANELEKCLVVCCEVTKDSVATLKERLIYIQHLTHRHYSKTRDVPVRVIFAIEEGIERDLLLPSLVYMKKMQRGENKNILGFDRLEIEALEKRT